MVAGLDNVQSVTSPYQPGGERQISQNGQIAYAEVEAPFDASFEETAEVGRQIQRGHPGASRVCGSSSEARPSPSSRCPSSEALGIGFAIIILIIAFGSVLAMGLPIGVALAGIFSGSPGSPAVQPGEHAGLR